jgi:cell division protein FtsB
MIKRLSDMTGKIKGRTILFALGMLIGGSLLFRSAYKYFDMKTQRDGIKNEIEQLKEDNIKLQEKINNLYNDKEYVEQVAREQLNMVKDGETVYIISRD